MKYSASEFSPRSDASGVGRGRRDRDPMVVGGVWCVCVVGGRCCCCDDDGVITYGTFMSYL